MLTIREIAEKTGLPMTTFLRPQDSRFAGKVKESTRKRIMAVCARIPQSDFTIRKGILP